MFKDYKRLTTTEAPMEYFATTASETYVLGEALVLTTGALTKCGATATPEFIAQKAYVAPATGMLPLPVKRVMEDMIFETAFSATGTAIVAGDKLTIDSTGLLVTATTTNGVFMVVQKEGTGATGEIVRGSFRR